MAVETGRARAIFAADPNKSRGRLHPEPPSATRNAFRRDCDRIIHATAFRRLKHKTQVFIFHEGDHYRTRLTHTLEVTQIARALARALGLDEDLAEALALAHDLGHPPFGHAGERALNECLSGAGGFDHNAQTLRIVTAIERRYPEFDGLNLSWETLEGIIKHNGPLTDGEGRPVGRYCESGLSQESLECAALHGFDLACFASAEAQIASIADDIAYDAHDVDDGIRAEFFSVGDLADAPVLGELLSAIGKEYPDLDPARVVHELIRRLIGVMIEDVIVESSERLLRIAPRSVEDIRRASEPVIAFSERMARADQRIKTFLFQRMYRHPRISGIMADAERVVRDLFSHYLANPADLPKEWTCDLGGADRRSRKRRIADFIAGMTDGYALIEHARYFDLTPELR